MGMPFSFRVKMGQQEIEISGTREEVIKTIGELPSLVASISRAFELTKNIDTASQSVASTYPSIPPSTNCSEAVLNLLETDWGKQARTLPELEEALKVNAIHYPSTTLSGVLTWLLRKNKIKRWKTDRGYVYVLAGGKA